MSLSEESYEKGLFLLKERAAFAEKVALKYLEKKKNCFYPPEGYQGTVYEAMEYSVKAGGKRLRPVIMYSVFSMLGGNGDIVEPFMAAIEYIHTYSLIHDDLPAMDNDVLRRGRDTVWVKYGEAMAVLAGDSLLNYAFETALYSRKLVLSGSNTEKAHLMDCVARLSEYAGIHGMIGGQVADVEAEKAGLSIDIDRLLFIHEYKTSALLCASFVIGALLAGASEVTIKKLENVAKDIGLAFQIRDDILDVTGDEALLGKPVGSDEANKKVTYVSLKGLEDAKKAVRELTERALAVFETVIPDGENEDGRFLKWLLRYLADREY